MLILNVNVRKVETNSESPSAELYFSDLTFKQKILKQEISSPVNMLILNVKMRHCLSETSLEPKHGVAFSDLIFKRKIGNRKLLALLMW